MKVEMQRVQQAIGSSSPRAWESRLLVDHGQFPRQFQLTFRAVPLSQD